MTLTAADIIGIEQYLDGTLTVDQIQAFRVRMRSNPVLRQAFVQTMQLHGPITAAFHPDAECQRLTSLFDGTRDGRRFESRVMRKIGQVPATQTSISPASERQATYLHKVKNCFRRRPSARGRVREAARPPIELRAWYAKTGSLVAIAACFLIIASIFFLNRWMVEQQPYLIVAALTGDGEGFATSSSGEKRNLVSGSPVFENEWIEAGSDTSMTLQYSGENTTIKMSDGRAVFRAGENDSKNIEIDSGYIVGHVSPQAAPFIILTPNATATVLGTIFELSVTASETRLSMLEGRVRLSRNRDGRYLEVPAGMLAKVDGQERFKLEAIESKKQITENIVEENSLDAGESVILSSKPWALHKFSLPNNDEASKLEGRLPKELYRSAKIKYKAFESEGLEIDARGTTVVMTAPNAEGTAPLEIEAKPGVVIIEYPVMLQAKGEGEDSVAAFGVCPAFFDLKGIEKNTVIKKNSYLPKNKLIWRKTSILIIQEEDEEYRYEESLFIKTMDDSENWGEELLVARSTYRTTRNRLRVNIYHVNTKGMIGPCKITTGTSVK